MLIGYVMICHFSVYNLHHDAKFHLDMLGGKSLLGEIVATMNIFAVESYYRTIYVHHIA